MNDGNTFGAIVFLGLVVLYFVPWIIAACRNHHQRSAILLLNLFLGWTLLGWVAAIVWSATAIPAKET